jgi:hypothetical protein
VVPASIWASRSTRRDGQTADVLIANLLTVALYAAKNLGKIRYAFAEEGANYRRPEVYRHRIESVASSDDR